MQFAEAATADGLSNGNGRRVSGHGRSQSPRPQRMSHAAALLMSESRRAVVAQLRSVEQEAVAQANSCVVEMGVPVRFAAHLVVSH